MVPCVVSRSGGSFVCHSISYGNKKIRPTYVCFISTAPFYSIFSVEDYVLSVKYILACQAIILHVCHE